MISSWVLEGARDGRSVAELMSGTTHRRRPSPLPAAPARARPDRGRRPRGRRQDRPRRGPLPHAARHDVAGRGDQRHLHHRGRGLPAPPRAADERIRAVRTGCCPHTAIRDDITANLDAVEELVALHDPDLVLVGSGGDNLTVTGDAGPAGQRVRWTHAWPVVLRPDRPSQGPGPSRARRRRSARGRRARAYRRRRCGRAVGGAQRRRDAGRPSRRCSATAPCWSRPCGWSWRRTPRHRSARSSCWAGTGSGAGGAPAGWRSSSTACRYSCTRPRSTAPTRVCAARRAPPVLAPSADRLRWTRRGADRPASGGGPRGALGVDRAGRSGRCAADRRHRLR